MSQDFGEDLNPPQTLLLETPVLCKTNISSNLNSKSIVLVFIIFKFCAAFATAVLLFLDHFSKFKHLNSTLIHTYNNTVDVLPSDYLVYSNYIIHKITYVLSYTYQAICHLIYYVDACVCVRVCQQIFCCFCEPFYFSFVLYFAEILHLNPQCKTSINTRTHTVLCLFHLKSLNNYMNFVIGSVRPFLM